MPDHKKPTDRGVADSIAALRHMRYMTRGAGQFERKKSAAPKPSVDQLRKKVAKVATKKKARKGKRK
jgi:hypothetical protein